MAITTDNKVGETSTTTGVGDYTVSGAIDASWQTFTDSAVVDGDTVYYLAVEDTVGWEVVTGVWTLSGTTLSRVTIHGSSNSGSAVNWAAGTRKIYIVTPEFIVQYLINSKLGGDGTAKATGTYAYSGGGINNLASAPYSVITGGREALSRDLQGCEAFSGNNFSSQGDAQIRKVVLMKETTSGTIGKMTSDGGAGSTANMPVVPAGYAYYMYGKVLAWDSTNSDRAAYSVKILVYRETGGTMTLQYSNFVTDVEDDLVAWGGLSVTANDTNKAIELKCQGAAATTIRWVGYFAIIEIG